ncbi:GGDEF domain-containing protein [Citrobacter farmeri]|uniref:GGDEF domain-containing protein n=1 Tax=Citrobacter farmeri TaxID=67824 RepID=UPI0018978AF8|nr:GGDEF domain-containing protein [Citrobacter farmeri]MBJ9133514.1 GGDEF domain-containing protein [Citrobacter farmeri]MDB2167764.1 GGDEF domain-containing protein [Citrobacter farmeri]MDZ7528605.1 GGDEF domain-containing protein [Citrobacter farmeri]HCD2000731.1 GGDEF domain-containing protein [Citrobacter farmeri]HCD2003291.1 GGDEF domain-containing protein [Citrobacter farmeri]
MNFSLHYPGEPKGSHGSTRSLILLALGILIIAVILYVSWWNYPGIYFDYALQHPQTYFDLTLVLLLLMALYLTGKFSAYTKHSVPLRSGLLIWLAGATLEFSEHLIFQPDWLSFLKNFLSLTGIFLVCISGYKKIRDLEKLYALANTISKYDDLTRLPNRRFFINTIHDLSYTSLGLILIDIDHFKNINDTYGHVKGDEILRKFGMLLSACSSESCIPTRIGGEEFAVMVKNATSKTLSTYASIIMHETSKIVIDEENALSISIGLGIKNKDEKNSAFIKRVDEALYKAKNTGRGKTEWSQ